MFFKHSIEVKNPVDLDMIPHDKLFISESKYAYNVDDIFNYFQGQGKYFDRDQRMVNRSPGLLCDFKNRDNGLRHFFTEKDVLHLASYPGFQDLFFKKNRLEDLVNTCALITPTTLNLMKRVADAAVIMENPAREHDESVTQAILVPLVDLYHHLKIDTKGGLPPSELPLAAKSIHSEVFALKRLTMRDGLLPYFTDRGFDFKSEIELIIEKRNCTSGFNQAITNLYGAIVTYQNYNKVFSQKEEEGEKEEGPGPHS